MNVHIYFRISLAFSFCIANVSCFLPHFFHTPPQADTTSASQVCGVIPVKRQKTIVSRSKETSTSLRNDLRDDIERAAQQRAFEDRSRGGGAGETAAGAILGGILGGPFGLLFGAQIGASLGAARTVDKARVEEMKRKGITPDMLDMATEVGVALGQAVEGLSATEESVETSKRLARSLEQQSESMYERATKAIKSGDEEAARKHLLEREAIKEKMVKVLKSAAEDRKRLELMKSNVEALETRALEIESLLRRSVGASAIKDSSGLGLSLEAEDPLIKKFRDLGM